MLLVQGCQARDPWGRYPQEHRYQAGMPASHISQCLGSIPSSQCEFPASADPSGYWGGDQWRWGGDASAFWAPAPHVGDLMKFLAWVPASSQLLWGIWGSEIDMERTLGVFKEM